ncbi:MAG: TIGR03560 family F420-dependent LLM class oxidoreductase [Actinomycetota bacterium]
MRLALDVAQHQLTYAEVLERVRYAEEVGFDGAWVFDHFEPLYGDPDGPCLESWTLLGALAASTTSIRLGTLVSGMTYRHPSILATEAVTVDQISGGRLEIGLGASWHEDEHAELGIPFPAFAQRAERLEEGIEVMRALMTEEAASFEGEHFQLDDANYNPKPIQQPHPPIWIGAEGEKVMLPIVARQADAWHTYGTDEELAKRSARLDDLAESYQRDPESILRATDVSISEDFDDVRKRAESLRELGFSYLVVSWPTEGWDRVEEFVTKVMPELVG